VRANDAQRKARGHHSDPMSATSPDFPEASEPIPLMAAPEPLPPPPAPVGARVTMPARIDREFVVKNRLVERYIGGRLPLRGAQDLERFCREHPELLDEISLSDNINGALRLLDASGRASPWEPEPKKWWQPVWVLIATGAVTVVLGCSVLVLSGKLSGRDHTIAELKQRITLQPLEPTTSTRSIPMMPNRVGPSRRSLATIGGASVEMADIKIDMSWSPLDHYQVTVDRVDEGRVAILHNVKRDSSGVLHLELNSSALGPGSYQFSIDGLDRWGNPVPQAWATISIVR
jgi:hypothetical protein